MAATLHPYQGEKPTIRGDRNNRRGQYCHKKLVQPLTYGATGFAYGAVAREASEFGWEWQYNAEHQRHVRARNGVLYGNHCKTVGCTTPMEIRYNGPGGCAILNCQRHCNPCLMRRLHHCIGLARGGGLTRRVAVELLGELPRYFAGIVGWSIIDRTWDSVTFADRAPYQMEGAPVPSVGYYGVDWQLRFGDACDRSRHMTVGIYRLIEMGIAPWEWARSLCYPEKIIEKFGSDSMDCQMVGNRKVYALKVFRPYNLRN